MSLSAAVIRELISAGLEGDALAAACDRIEAAELAKKTPNANALRQRRFRERKAESDANERYNNVTVTQKEALSPTPPIQEKHTPLSPPKGGHSPHEFSEFWAAYPHKVGKGAAVRALSQALRKATMAEIMAGLTAYASKSDDRPWCNPATWLNQERWTDAPAPPVEARAAAPPGKQPRNPGKRTWIDALEAIENGSTQRQIEGSRGNVERLPAVGG